MKTYATLLDACKELIGKHEFKSNSTDGRSNGNKTVRITDSYRFTNQPEVPELKEGDSITFFRSPLRCAKSDVLAFVEHGTHKSSLYGSGAVKLRVRDGLRVDAARNFKRTDVNVAVSGLRV